MRLVAKATMSMEVIVIAQDVVVVQLTLPNQPPQQRKLRMGDKWTSDATLTMELPKEPGTTVEVQFDA